jgi:HK97 family phage prohead protease
MNNIEHRHASLHELKLAGDGTTQGKFTGYASVFNVVDSYGDVIAKGAFKDTLREWEDRGKLPLMLLQHGGGPFGGSANDMLPIGKWTNMEENSKGLKVEGELFAMNTERGQYLIEGMKAGVLDGLSIGFRTRKATQGTKPGEPIRTLTDVDLVEVSVVALPANPKARVSNVKAMALDEWRDFEADLRDAGLSRQHARTAVARLKKFGRRDAGHPDHQRLREAAAPEHTAESEALAAANALLEKLVNGSLRI